MNTESADINSWSFELGNAKLVDDKYKREQRRDDKTNEHEHKSRTRTQAQEQWLWHCDWISRSGLNEWEGIEKKG